MMGASGFSLLAGNEKISAVYQPVVEKQRVVKQDYRSIEQFLAGMEKRRKKKTIDLWIQQFPEAIRIFTKRQIEISSLPRPAKDELINFLKKIKSLKMGNW